MSCSASLMNHPKFGYTDVDGQGDQVMLGRYSRYVVAPTSIMKYSNRITATIGIMNRGVRQTVFSAMIFRSALRRYPVVRKRVEVVKNRPVQMLLKKKGSMVRRAQYSLL
jgi:hypothetical protein